MYIQLMTEEKDKENDVYILRKSYVHILVKILTMDKRRFSILSSYFNPVGFSESEAILPMKVRWKVSAYEAA